MSGVFQWSQTAANNATADPTVNWVEGQAPSTVNDSARAVMASVAKWRDDLAGLLITGGTSTAYTLTSNQVFTSLSAMGGQTVSFLPHTTSGSSPTLNVDGLGAKPLVIDNGATALPAASFNQASLYSATYSSSGGFWLVHSLYSGNTLFPSGTLMLFQQTAAPTGWTKQSTHNDKALRVVSGTASSGGSVAFSTVFAQTTTGSYTLLIGDIPSHNHGGNTGNQSADHTHGITSAAGTAGSLAAGGGAVLGAGPTDTGIQSANHTHTISSQGGGGSHSHTMDVRVQYVDLIICAKA